MTRYFLSELKVEGFRGVNNEGNPLALKFKPRAVNSVFAANGSGKSSLYEALQFAFSGAVSRLQEMQASEQPDDYLPNLFHSTGISTIDLTLTPDDGTPNVAIRVIRNPTGERIVTSPSGHPNPTDLLSALNQDFALLDYAKFSKFIEDTALSRGRSFSSLLGLSDYADMRRALKTVTHTQTFRADFDIATLEEKQLNQRKQFNSAISEFSERYREIVGKDLTDTKATEEAAVEIVQALAGVALIQEHVKDKTLDDIDFEAIGLEITTAENGADRVRLTDLIQEKQRWGAEPDTPASAIANFAEIRSALNAHEAYVAETSGATKHALLRAAESFFETETAWNDHHCPLCDSQLDTSLKEHVRVELEAFKAANQSQKRLLSLISNGAFLSRLQFVEQLPEIIEPDEKALSGPFAESSRAGTLNNEGLNAAESHIQLLEKRVTSTLSQIADEIGELQSRLPPSLVTLTTQVAQAKSAFSALKTIRSMRMEMEGVASQLEVFERWKKFIGTAHQVFGAAESSLSKQILDELRDDYQEMFVGIMSVRDVVPTLTRDSNGEQLKVELEEFHGRQEISARAVLSESYRNALAISVFLSAAVKYGKMPRFVVLDDITSSFDSGHQFHLMEQIRSRLQFPANPNGVQFIILSHDVTLEKYFDRLGDEPGWNHQKLQGWPPYTPISALGQDPNRLRSEAERFLRAGQVEQASGLIRQYLEFTLQQVIRKVNIPVPIDLAVNDHAKMAGACVDAILSAVKLHEKAGSLCMEPQQVSDLTGRHAPAIVANWINHYGTAGSASFSPPSLLGVLSNIDLLRQCFQHDVNNSGDLRFYKSLTRRT